MVPTAHEPSEKLIYAQPAPCSDSPSLLGVVDEECLAGWGCAPASTRGMCLLCCLHQGWRLQSCRPLRGCLRQGRCACLRKHADWQRWIRERQGRAVDLIRCAPITDDAAHDVHTCCRPPASYFCSSPSPPQPWQQPGNTGRMDTADVFEPCPLLQPALMLTWDVAYTAHRKRAEPMIRSSGDKAKRAGIVTSPLLAHPHLLTTSHSAPSPSPTQTHPGPSLPTSPAIASPDKLMRHP
jgi:hypothetical protein